MAHHKPSKSEIRKLIRLQDDLVLCGGAFGMLPILTPDPRVGRAIVRALRELAATSPAGFFPRSGRKR